MRIQVVGVDVGFFFGSEIGAIEICRRSDRTTSRFFSTLSPPPFPFPLAPTKNYHRKDRRTSDNPIRLLIRPFVPTIDHSLRALGGHYVSLRTLLDLFFPSPYHHARIILGKTTRCVTESPAAWVGSRGRYSSAVY